MKRRGRERRKVGEKKTNQRKMCYVYPNPPWLETNGVPGDDRKCVWNDQIFSYYGKRMTRPPLPLTGLT